MRLMVDLVARRDTAYDHTYHHKLRGRIWQALSGTEFDAEHHTGDPPGFVYSNPFPPGDMDEGDERKLLVASPREQVLTHVARDLQTDPEFNVGEMPFRVTDVNALSPDVGEPGTRGVLETGTGVVVRIPPWKFDDYDLDLDDEDTFEFWKPEYSRRPLRQQLRDNLDQKHRKFAFDHHAGPSEVDGPLFDEYERIKTFALPVTVTQGQEMTYVVSKWRFRYQVRDEDHRRHLNLALDAGIGERNALGFGFLNVTEKTTTGGERIAYSG